MELSRVQRYFLEHKILPFIDGLISNLSEYVTHNHRAAKLRIEIILKQNEYDYTDRDYINKYKDRYIKERDENVKLITDTTRGEIDNKINQLWKDGKIYWTLDVGN